VAHLVLRAHLEWHFWRARRRRMRTIARIERMDTHAALERMRAEALARQV
jgi:hypothetical protein